VEPDRGKSDPLSGRIELTLPSRVHFGRGTAMRVGEVVRSLGRSALLCVDHGVLRAGLADGMISSLAREGVNVAVHPVDHVGVPLASIEEPARLAQSADCIVGVGGGSCLDLAKMAALIAVHGGPPQAYFGENHVSGPCLPIVAVPTTAGTGSEMSASAIVFDPATNLKMGIASRFLVPRVAICDPALTDTCPAQATAYAGVDALVHAIEAYLAIHRSETSAIPDDAIFQGQNEFSRLFALAAIESIVPALQVAIDDGAPEARNAMMLGSLLAGLAFAHAGTAGAHALEYAFSTYARTPHGLGTGLVTPYILEFVRPAVLAKLATLGHVLGIEERGASPDALATRVIAKLTSTIRAAGIPATLCEVGVRHADLPSIAHQAAGIERLLRNSPRRLDEAALLMVLEAAWTGSSASAKYRAR
jgi:alcohol dehydrogenase class IV